MKRHALLRDILLGLGVFAVLIAVVLLSDSSRLVDLLTRVSIFGLFALSLNVLIGYTGLVSLGHGMFFASGAYSFALLMRTNELSVPAGIVLAVLFTLILALVVGAICVRLREIYFAFLTLAFQMFLYSLIDNWNSVTGGDQGLIGGIPRPPFLGINLADKVQLCLFSIAIVIGSAVVLRHILQSPFGYTLRLIRDNQDRAAYLGVRVRTMKLACFVLASGFASLAGILMATLVSGAFPAFAYWTISAEGIFMIVIGGLSSFLGPIVGAFILTVLEDLLTAFSSDYYGLILGAFILLFALGLRRGLVDFLNDKLKRL
jgi:branched-chain amino acid transport system permease protein